MKSHKHETLDRWRDGFHLFPCTDECCPVASFRTLQYEWFGSFACLVFFPARFNWIPKPILAAPGSTSFTFHVDAVTIYDNRQPINYVRTAPFGSLLHLGWTARPSQFVNMRVCYHRSWYILRRISAWLPHCSNWTNWNLVYETESGFIWILAGSNYEIPDTRKNVKLSAQILRKSSSLLEHPAKWLKYAVCRANQTFVHIHI